MTQFTPQFVERFLKPLVKNIFTDMGKLGTEKGNPELMYLKRLMIGEKTEHITPLEREHFFRTYFRADKTKPFSTTEKEDVDFQNEFFDTFVQAFDSRKRLSGVEGTVQTFLPDQEEKFSEAAEKEIYRFTYKLSLVFEKHRVEELMKKDKGSITAKDKENIETGKVKLIIVDGIERYITEEEAVLAAQNPATANIKVQTYSGEEKTLGQLPTSYSDAKIASIEMAMEENGLEIIEPLKADPQNPNMVHGVVRDVSGQKLNVDVDMNVKAEDPRKLNFTFQESPTGKQNRKGEKFQLSLNDLQKFQTPEGKRKTAEEVTHPEVGKLAQEKVAPIMDVPLKPLGANMLPLMGLPSEEAHVEGEMPEDFDAKLKGGALQMPIGKRKQRVLPMLPKGAQVPLMSQTKTPEMKVSIPEGSLIGPHGAPELTVQQQKKAVQESKVQAPGAVIPPMLPRPVALGEQTPAPSKRKSHLGRWVVAAHAGTFGGILGSGVWSAVSQNQDAAKKVVVMVLKGIGLS